MWRKARLHPREHLLPPGKIVHCRCSVKRRVPVPRETRYTTCRQKIIRKGSAFHRISVQVISHQRVDQPPRCPISERTGPQSKAPLQGGNEPLPPLCQNGSPARRSIAFHDSPKRCVLFQNVPLLRISWYRGVPFWNSLHLVAENSATKDHSAVLRAG